MIDALVIAHVVATIAMAGLIWFVQVVHYPLMARVGEAGFVQYEAAHVRLTTVVVAPFMLTELTTAVWLWLEWVEPRWMTNWGLGLLFVVWISTAVFQVPCHRVLERGFDASVVKRLVVTNWIRTLGWSARAALAMALAWSVAATPITG